jgi:hypothetical protein
MLVEAERHGSTLSRSPRSASQPARHPFIPRKTIIIGSIILGSMTLLGGTAVAATVNNWTALPSAIPGAEPSYGVIPEWHVNENGQTYGIQGSNPVPPDLIRAQGPNGGGMLVDGYTLSADEAEPMARRS